MKYEHLQDQLVAEVKRRYVEENERTPALRAYISGICDLGSSLFSWEESEQWNRWEDNFWDKCESFLSIEQYELLPRFERTLEDDTLALLYSWLRSKGVEPLAGEDF